MAFALSKRNLKKNCEVKARSKTTGDEILAKWILNWKNANGFWNCAQCTYEDGRGVLRIKVNKVVIPVELWYKPKFDPLTFVDENRRQSLFHPKKSMFLVYITILL